MYLDDNNEYFPTHGCGWGTRSYEICYAAKIHPYLNSLDVFKCPSDTRGAQPGSDSNAYGNNLQYVAGRSSVRVGQINSPTATIWYGDGTRGYLRAPRCCGITTTSPLCTHVPLDDNISWRHNDGAVFAFVDGHAERYRRSPSINMTNYYWDRN
jgi:prepilin-type processing-associated H-X9-DG protein